MSVVLVLNADYGPLRRVSLRRAIRMLFREVAVVHEAQPDARIGVYPIPTVVRLVSYVVTRWRRSRGPAWTRAGVLARDGRRCGSCGRCNGRKGNRTPAEARMPLRRAPWRPS
jgi:5-methylcytosine-specific restriction endonuclease McrA